MACNFPCAVIPKREDAEGFTYAVGAPKISLRKRTLNRRGPSPPDCGIGTREEGSEIRRDDTEAKQRYI
jgi:hypothetical protein